MNKNILDFCTMYIKKLKNDKDIKENEIDYLRDFRDRINFYVTAYSTCPNVLSFGYSGKKLFCLDDDDLIYLYDKYHLKIKQEMEDNITEVKKMYEIVE